MSITQVLEATKKQFTVDPALRMGAVRLGVSQLDKMVTFYTKIIGLDVLTQDAGQASLGLNNQPLLYLEKRTGQRYPQATGLYHLALLLPSRQELGRWLRHLNERGYPLSGASDHFVSEALYLSDPEGNGIEIYRDRPRSEWTQQDDGSLNIGTVRLNLESLLADALPEPFTGLPSGTVMGHVHLQVADVPSSAAFYRDVLGFEVMNIWREAGFLAAGGYHHHLGMNIWHSHRATPPPSGSLGLINYEIVLSGKDGFDSLIRHIQEQGHPFAMDGNHAVLADPSGNQIILTFNS